MFHVHDFGLSEYSTVWSLQQDWVRQRVQGTLAEDKLLVGEHFPVFTVGRRINPENWPDTGIPVLKTERGGDITYHGPGQLIAYPIFLLPEGRRDLRRFLRDLEETIILTLAGFNIQGDRVSDLTGVWVKSRSGDGFRKIASIGVAIKQWVTYHGLALNVQPDLEPFRQINPCGLQGELMTSMACIAGQNFQMETVKEVFVRQFQRVFG
ncbi:MAG TPA: lipoyl(octanoyl) transferase LipB [Oculatellaceae cyanobacterium]